MKTSEIKRIKQLVRDTFWQFEDETDRTLTPGLIRGFVREGKANMPPDWIEVVEILDTQFKGFEFWEKAEALCKGVEVYRRFTGRYR